MRNISAKKLKIGKNKRRQRTSRERDLFISSMAEFSSVVPLLLTIVEGDKCREDFKRILLSAFTSSSAS